MYDLRVFQFRDVSIPYRSAKNPIETYLADQEQAMFQFLIGQLKTDNTVRQQIAIEGFQFLIGQLKTFFSFMKTEGQTGFNSL